MHFLEKGLLVTSVVIIVTASVGMQKSCSRQAAQSMMVGAERVLRDSPDTAGPAASDAVVSSRAGLLVIALDGVDRTLLYDMLDAGQLPGLASLLGATGPESRTFPHAYFSDRLLSVLPSSTAPAWAATFTGQPPAVNGVPGNEYFIRAENRFELPVGVTVGGNATALSTYNEGYFNGLLASPTVYQQLRAAEPDIRIWVGLQQVFAGADRLILTEDSVFIDGAQATLAKLAIKQLSETRAQSMTAQLDQGVIEQTIRSLDAEVEAGGVDSLPDVLTLYLPGADKIAHVSEAGPTPARRQYLREQLDPYLGTLAATLQRHGALDNRYVVVTSDHGHTEVVRDKAHALDRSGKTDPPAVIKQAGFRLRPFKREVPPSTVFDTVIAYQGAMAFVYVADRSGCADNQPCDWTRPARLDADVTPLAEAFYTNNQTGALVPELKGTLDMVLVRGPGGAFVEYTGEGATRSLRAALRASPRPQYVDLERRLRDLAVGPHGDRAGDILLIANNGNVDAPDQRYYFAAPARSWHGSPSRQDSEIPLIVAHPDWAASALAARVDQLLGPDPGQTSITPLLTQLRASE